MADLVIDVPLPDDVKSFLARPKCLDIGLPPPGNVEINLPTGGRLKGIVDATKAIPDDCSLTFSLALQLGPFLASIECLMKLMKLIQPLIDVIKGLGPPPDVIKLGTAIPKFLDAAKELMPCVLNLTGAGFPLFVKDLLCLIIKILKCLIGQLESLAKLMGGLQLQIQTASAEGNTELLAQLQCAQENAAASAGHVAAAIDPVTFLLTLAEPILGVVGVGPFTIPTFGSPQDAQAVEDAVGTLKGLVQVLEAAVEPLGGC